MRRIENLKFKASLLNKENIMMERIFNYIGGPLQTGRRSQDLLAIGICLLIAIFSFIEVLI